MSFGSSSQNCPQVGQAPHLATGLPPVWESPRTWRQMSTCRRQEDTGCLAQCFQPACAKVSAAGGQKPSLTTGGFPAGPPSCLSPDITQLCQALPGYASLTQTQQGHTPRNRSSCLLLRPQGRKCLLPGHRGSQALSPPICTKHGA